MKTKNLMQSFQFKRGRAKSFKTLKGITLPRKEHPKGISIIRDTLFVSAFRIMTERLRTINEVNYTKKYLLTPLPKSIYIDYKRVNKIKKHMVTQ